MNNSSGRRRKSSSSLLEDAASAVRRAYILERRAYGQQHYEPSDYWEGGKTLRGGEN